MSLQSPPWLGIASINAGIAVALGAFAAHALKTRLTPNDLAVFEVAVRYQMYHALALIGVALADGMLGSSTLLSRAAGYLFCGGIVVFSGSLYALVATGARWLGMLTPLGGLAFLAGWACLAAAAFRS